MTTTERTRNSALHTRGLGEIIRAHRLFIGLSQQDMADRLGRDRRDYQRIETGKDACPPGLLGQIEEMSDDFHHQVEAVKDAAEEQLYGPVLELRVSLSSDPAHIWDRLVAGRAAVETAPDAPIRLVAPDYKPAEVG